MAGAQVLYTTSSAVISRRCRGENSKEIDQNVRHVQCAYSYCFCSLNLLFSFVFIVKHVCLLSLTVFDAIAQD